MSGFDHAKVVVSKPSNNPKKSKSIDFTVIGGSDNFVNYYNLISSSSKRALSIGKMDLTIRIEGIANQTEYYLSNDHTLLDAVENNDASNIKKVF